MPCRALCFRSGWLGGITVLVLATAIVLMLGFSVAPNLHERLHPTGASLHECAVTLIASGSCHYNCCSAADDRAHDGVASFEDSGSQSRVD